MGEACQIFSALMLTQVWVTEITWIVGQSSHQIWTRIPDAECLI